MIELTVNGKKVQVDVPEDTPLLWVIREELKLTGTKFGCGKGLCGACTVHLNGNATRTCILPVSAAEGQSVNTIESLEKDGKLHEVQQAWIKHNVPQCGYCQSGQIMQAISVIENNNKQTKDELTKQMSDNLCRCGTYHKIKEAIFEAAENMGKLKART